MNAPDKTELIQRSILLRQEKVSKLLALGYSITAISNATNIPLATCSRDARLITQQAKEKIKRYADEIFPDEYLKALDLTNEIIKEAFQMSQTCKYERNKLVALNLIRETVALRADLLSSTNLVGRTVNYVESLRKRVDAVKQDKLVDTESVDGTFGGIRERPILVSPTSQSREQEQPQYQEGKGDTVESEVEVEVEGEGEEQDNTSDIASDNDNVIQDNTGEEVEVESNEQVEEDGL